MNKAIADEINNILLKELSDKYKISVLKPGDVTAEMLSNETGLSRKWCVDLLEQKVIAGELTKYRIRNRSNTGFMYAYSKVIVKPL